MKRRKRVLLMGMLTGIWLCAQSPFAQAQPMQPMPPPQAEQHTTAEVPCHGDQQPEPAHSETLADDCCDGGHCDGHCAQLSLALATPTPRCFARAMAWQTPFEPAGLPRVHQPEPFRPPI